MTGAWRSVDERFLESWINKSAHVVLGRRLHALCLHDFVALAFVDSPFISIQDGDEETQIQDLDLELAVHICSSTPGAARDSEFFHIGPWAHFRRALWFRLWHWQPDFQEECAKFFRYVKDYYSVPLPWVGNGEKIPGSDVVPWPLLVAARLMANSQLTREEAWALPIGEALWLSYAIVVNSKDGVDLMSQGEEEALREAGMI